MEQESKRDLSHAEKIENEIAGFGRVDRRLAIVMAIGLVLAGGWWLWDHTHGIPHLKKEVEEATGERDKAFRNRDEALRARDDALRAKEEVARERDKYLTVYTIVQSAANANFSNAAPDKRIDLLLDRVGELKALAETANRQTPKSRRLTEDAMAKIRDAFKGVDRTTYVDIECVVGATDSAVLGKQLEWAIGQAGIKTDLRHAQYVGAPMGILLTVKDRDPAQYPVLRTLQESLGEAQRLSLDTNLAPKEIHIRIGH